MKINTMLLTDFYKVTHMAQYSKEVEHITSYFVPRMARLKSMPEPVFFGLSSTIQEYLIEHMNENFFDVDKKDMVADYIDIMSRTLGSVPTDHAIEEVSKLHDLGYLPIRIQALPEGNLVTINVPAFSITNTHPRFAWVVNAIETLLSNSLWHKMISATVALRYIRVVNRFVHTMEDSVNPLSILGDFSFRGQESVESGIGSSAAFLAAGFTKTATIPAIEYLHRYYDAEYEEIASGLTSTEHSVMCSNYSIDGDEETFIRRLLLDLYPNTPFSMVVDSYDYWNVIENIIPGLKDIILARSVPVMLRGDSGDPVEIVTKSVYSLYKHFGEVNSKGYKTLHKNIRVVYGDSITPERAEAIYKILEQEGFSSETVFLGVGSFSMQAVEEGEELLPFTRDTFGIAIKATHALLRDGSEIEILKDPKTDSANFKKSHKGLISVLKTDTGYEAVDGLRLSSVLLSFNELETVFEDSEMVGSTNTLAKIRERVLKNA